ncbi:hypothetical protein CA11_15850 [Gimesia maris]|uniref:YegP family protein n=1 Tax=Gimesia maris TaxID=122 RepID=UPI00118AA7F7|nr:hypothetical protein CA11_15850 [Gimesia maris]
MSYYYWKSNKDKLWYWHLKANNHEIIARSTDGYINKADCLSSIKLVKNSGNAPEKEL